MIHIITNGGMRSPKFWANLAIRFKDRLGIQFSIDGTVETHALYRIGTSYNKVVANAKAFMDAGGYGQRRTIIFKHSEHELARIQAESKEIGFHKLAVIPGDLFRYHGQDKWAAYENGVITHYLEMPAVTDFSEYEYDNLPAFDLSFTKDKNLFCPNFRAGHIYVTYKGHIIPCCNVQADLYFDHPKNDRFREVYGDYAQSDLNLRTLSDIFADNSRFFDRLETSIKSDNVIPKCVGCHKYKGENVI